MNQAAALFQQEIKLPALREDLQLMEGPADISGARTWTVLDPISNRFVRIGWLAFQLMTRWDSETVSKLIQRMKEEMSENLSEEDIVFFIKFLHKNNLTRDSANNNSIDYYEQFLAGKPSLLMWLLKNYLFIRIPLVKPANFLEIFSPLLGFLFSKKTAIVLSVLGLIGVYLVLRQWEVFVNTFVYFFTFEGLLFYFAALVIIKVLHEMGHAFTAHYYGCKVPAIGVAFLVMFPVLYTDTTDAWKLKSRKQRLYIGAAGIIVELYIALIALFIWSFLPDGIVRSIAFFFATTSLILSLTVNLNAFMRFDGYYILSDWLGIDNLQEKSFSLGKWKLREILFGLNAPLPLRLPKKTQTILILYSWGVWVYRFFLFLGIALIVYYFFFKVLGIILFLAEIIFFLGIPIGKELWAWWNMREIIVKRFRFYITASIFGLFLLLMFIPWNTKIQIPAVLESSDKVAVHSPSMGRIVKVYAKQGDFVAKGEILFQLESPQIENELEQVETEIAVLEQLSNRSAASQEDLSNLHVTLQKLAEKRSRLSGLIELQEDLTILAPTTGVITDIASALHRGRWINEELELAFIAEPLIAGVEGFVKEDHLNRVSESQEALFIPNDPSIPSVKTLVSSVEQTNTKFLDIPYLSSEYKGKIAVRVDDSGNQIPETGVFRVKLQIDDPDFVWPMQVIPGIVHIQAEKQSFASSLYRHIASVLIRESGF